MKHHRFAAVLTFAHPGGERRVEIVRVSGKPALELRDKCAAQSCIAKSHRWHDFVHRAQHRRMLIDVTFTRRKTRFTHPTIFRFEVLTKVGRKAFEVGLEVGVGAISRFRDKRLAIIAWNEFGAQRRITYRELHAEVTRIASALRECGVGEILNFRQR